MCKILHFSLRKSTKENSNRNRLMNDLNIALIKWKLLGNIAALLVFSVHTRLNKEKFSDFRVFARIRNCRKPEIERGCREWWSPSLEAFREEIKSLYSELLSPVLCGQHSKVMWGLIKLPDLQGVSQGAAFKPEEPQPSHFQHNSKTPLFSLELFTVACFSSHTLLDPSLPPPGCTSLCPPTHKWLQSAHGWGSSYLYTIP